MAPLRLGHFNGELLKSAREESGLSLEEIARSAGFGRSESLIQIESGESHPTLSQGEKIARKLQRPLAYFYLAAPPQGSSVSLIDNRSPSSRADLSSPSIFAMRRMHVQSSASEISLLLGQELPELPRIDPNWSSQCSAGILRTSLRLDRERAWLLRSIALSRLISRMERSGHCRNSTVNASARDSRDLRIVPILLFCSITPIMSQAKSSLWSMSLPIWDCERMACASLIRDQLFGSSHCVIKLQVKFLFPRWSLNGPFMVLTLTMNI